MFDSPCKLLQPTQLARLHHAGNVNENWLISNDASKTFVTRPRPYEQDQEQEQDQDFEILLEQIKTKNKVPRPTPRLLLLILARHVIV